MKITNKIKEIYYKPRQGKFWDFTLWIVSSPKAFEVTLFMGYFVSIALFLSLSVWVGFLSEWNIFALIFPVLVLCVSLYQLFKLIRIKIKLKGKNIYDTLTLGDVLKTDNGGIQNEYKGYSFKAGSRSKFICSKKPKRSN